MFTLSCISSSGIMKLLHQGKNFKKAISFNLDSCTLLRNICIERIKFQYEYHDVILI